MNLVSDASIVSPLFGEDFVINPPSTLRLFGHTFYWYGAIIALGFLLAVIYCTKRCRQFGMTTNDIIDMLIVTVPAR
jgi:phosphatidylglycerol:prolipoprotein diacylglycerol transferase